MKKILVAAALLLAVGSYAMPHSAVANHIALEAKKGRHIDASQVPASVMATFTSMFPTAQNVRWEVERDNGQVVYTAKFTVNGQRQSARFLSNGTYIGS